MNSTEMANAIRKHTLDMVYKARASHIGGAFSMADILAVLYNDIMRIDPSDPGLPGRDRFFLSKGHACTSLYATLALREFFDLSLLDTYAKDGSILMSHASHKVPGVELSTGSLGHALPVACGVSLAAKRKGNHFHTYVLLSDGELDEGSNWEAILFAAHHQLDNLTCFIDYNKIQSFGRVEEVIGLHPLKEKFESFNWDTFEIDGHDHTAIAECLKMPASSKPKCVIAHTVKGKGVNFMENDLQWHYKSPSADQFAEAQKQL